MKSRKINKYYDAMGFAEALMAIMLVGISSMVLLQIAINTLNNAIQNEVIDHMTQYAMEGAEMTQDLYNKDKVEELTNQDEDRERYFPHITSEMEENCFIIDKEVGQVSFRRDPDDPNEFVSYSRAERNTYRHEALIPLEEYGFEDTWSLIWTTSINDQFFRVVCLEGDLDDDRPFLIARVIVGQRYFDEELFDGQLYGNLVRDYEYITIINL